MPDADATATEPATPPVPQWTPTTRELDDLELLVNDSFDPPLTGFVDPGEEPELATVTLVVDEATALTALAGGRLDLIDPEGAPLARLTPQSRWDAGDGKVGLAGPVESTASKAFGPFRRLHRSPAQVHADIPRDLLLAVAVRRPLTSTDLAAIERAAAASGKTVLLLATVGDGMPDRIAGPALVRATQAAAAQLTAPQIVVAVALADHGDAELNRHLLRRVSSAYAAETLDLPAEADPDAETPQAIASIVRAARPPRQQQGLVVFFTGLSGSGKSTLARALVDTVLEKGERTITSLDGDVVRHHLSKGLGFSREDRETNILRIGWVAAEIARHGGMAVCSPIAPFESTRAEVRRMVEAAGGGFVLIHVATPLEECERRDRKGLYAKARAGLIPDFTGISSPYEEPHNSKKVDTTDRDILECNEEILGLLTAEGWLTP